MHVERVSTLMASLMCIITSENLLIIFLLFQLNSRVAKSETATQASREEDQRFEGNAFLLSNIY